MMAALGTCPASRAAVFVFDKPSDDAWQYPFAFNAGSRDTGVVFSSVGNGFYSGFNDRDGVLLIAWNTSLQIPAGQAPSRYDVESVTVTLTHQDCPPGDCGSFVFPADWAVDLTVDEWFTYDVNNNGVRDGIEQPDADPGRPLELYGAGFGPFYSLTTWNENSPYRGATCVFGMNVCNFVPRDPYPLAFQTGNAAPLHAEDNIKGAWNSGVAFPGCTHPMNLCPFTAIPWAVGHPVNYTPGTQTAPFDVVFSIHLDLENGAVRHYFQQQLAAGRVMVTITSLLETDVQASGNPTFFLKEATEPSGGFPPIPGAKAPKLVIALADPPDGDIDNDQHVALDDYAAFRACMGGPGVTGFPVTTPCRQTFDFDGDFDIDIRDAAEFTRRFTGGN